MADYNYNLAFTIKTELTHQFEYSFGKVIEAHLNHKKGLGHKMSFFRTFVGGRDMIILSLPLESLGSMDYWMHTPEIVLEHYGRDEGLKILNLYCDATVSWETRILKSYDPCKAIE